MQATGNVAWGTLATPAFSQLLAAPKVLAWTPCPQGAVSGTCGLLMGDRYGPPLWQAVGHEREEQLYDHIVRGTRPDAIAAEAPSPVALPACAYPADALPQM